MSGNRPSLADAFAPVTQRGAKLEGMLAPKRRKIDGQSGDMAGTAPAEPALLVVVPEPTTEVEPTDAPALPVPSETDDGSEAQEKAIATRTVASSPTKSGQTAKKPANSSEKASESVPGAPRNVGVYLAPELLADVKEAVHLQRITYADLLLDAFDAVHEDVIAREFRPEPVPSSSGMPRRALRRRGSAGIQIQVRLDDEQIAWLDEKVVDFNAPSRSALVSTAYKLHLAKE
jgi:hypothetical protein